MEAPERRGQPLVVAGEAAEARGPGEGALNGSIINDKFCLSRAARFSSGLSLYDFLKRTSLVRCDARAFAALGPPTVALADAEGLPAHARSAAIRLGQTGGTW